ncbi:hypothetical protein ACO0K9_13105 [Undibacterium sp. Ji50W]|uniref:hypothetical protein n=1 Tax=Undibacterium sp. Ji50W TaxID=3413041 RepID=UPI003BF20CB1
MASAREKLPQLGLWDSEVSKPNHDTITLWAHKHAEMLARQYVTTYADHFNERGIDLLPDWPHALLERNPELGMPPPKCPTLVSKRELEAVLRGRSEGASRYNPILGYGDLLLHCEAHVLGTIESERPRKKEWWVETMRFQILVEVKTELPTLGELMRQLNLYRESVRHVIVVAPDEKYAELLSEQGILFVRYDADLT